VPDLGSARKTSVKAFRALKKHLKSIAVITRLAPMLCLLFSLAACGSRESTSVNTVNMEPIEVLSLKLHARQNEVTRFKHRIESAPAHSRFKAEADEDGLQERLITARLKLDALKSADPREQPQAHNEFNDALMELNRFLREVESRYQMETP
jgi:hypothetical protein